MIKFQSTFIYVFILELQALSGILSVRPDKPMQRNEGCTLIRLTFLNCSQQNLSYIPHVDRSVKFLIFGFNNLTNVTADTFRNVSSPKTLLGLQLDNNKIRNISSEALDVFIHLEFLNLTNNPIYYNNLKTLLGKVSRLQFLKELRMDGISTVTIQNDLFSLMKGNHIKCLNVENYDMKTVSFDTFKTFTSLKTLFLRNNHIEELVLSKYESIQVLYLKTNAMRSIPKFSIQGNESNCYIPNLKILDVSNNEINELRTETFACLLKLKELYIAGNFIRTLPNGVFSKMPSLTILYMISMYKFGPQHFRIEPFALRSKSLERLFLGFNAPAEYVFVSVDDTFKHLPNLKYLTLNHIILLKLTSQTISKLFSPLTNLVQFKCYDCALSQDPKCILNHMKRIEKISFLGNKITRLSDETFMHNKHLTYLSLRYNELSHIHESALPTSLLNRLSLLDLSKNPFECDCDLQWLITWMKTKQNKTVIAKYPHDYTCAKPTEKYSVQLSDISYTYKECHPWSPWIWVAVIASPCVAVLGIAVLILYRNRWNIKHYIFLLRKRRNYQRIPGDIHMYDAFVAYESTDSVWVRRRLLPVLEDDVGLRLCIHERDFLAGAFINDNIVNNIDASKKVIVVLTNAFARSGWCMFELKVAHSKLIEDETELIIILLEKIDARNMNHSLKVLFDTTTYIEWTEDDVGQELFWSKLKDIVKK